MDGISTYGPNTYNTQQILLVQQKMQDLQQQLTSGKKSSNYEGISAQAQGVLQFDNEATQIQNFQTNNTITTLRLNSTSTVVSSLSDTMTNFRNQLADFANTGKTDPVSINQIQQFAFNALKSMETYLNTDINGSYIFSGTATDTPPVDINAADLSQFQTNYDGSQTVFPTTRAADTASTSTNVQNTGSLTFDSTNGTIKSSVIGQFTNIPVGSVITVAGSRGGNGQYTVQSNDGTTITVGPTLTNEGPSAVTFTPANQKALVGVSATFSSPDTITATPANAFSGLTVGSSFTMAGATNAANNGNFVIASNDGTHIVIKRPTFAGQAILTNSGNDAAAVITSGPTSLTNATTGGVTFNTNPATGVSTITPTTPGSLANVPIGSQITVGSATAGGNNGTYVVTGYVSGALTVSSTTVTSLSTEAGVAGTISVNGTAVPATGNLSFSANTSLMTAANSGSLSSLAKGQTVNIASTTYNNGTAQVVDTFTTPVVAEVAAGGTAISAGTTSYLQAATGNLTFNAGAHTITAANAASLAGIAVGDAINITGTGSNNGHFVVTATNGTTLTVAPANTVVRLSQDATVSVNSMFKANDTASTQRIDTNQFLSTATTALDPAFEKAMRAMAMVAQGQYGTAGGLDQNAKRASDALNLMNDSITHTGQLPPPYQNESTRSLQDVEFTLANQQKTLSNVGIQQTNYLSVIQSSVDQIETADPTTTITNLLDQQRVLQTSYQSLAKIRSLSLIDYVK